MPMMPLAAVPQLPLKARTITAGLWTISGAVSSNVLRLLSNLVLTRLLFPDSFGLMVIATTVTVIMAMLSDVGIHQSIVRGPHGDDPVFLDTAWSVQIIRGACMWGGACLVTIGLGLGASRGWIPAHSTYADPSLPWILPIMCFSAVINGFQATDVSSANRCLQVKPLVLWELGMQVFNILLLIGLAWFMRSVWALVIGTLVSAVLATSLSHFVFAIHRNRFRIDTTSLHELLGFGKWLALSSAIGVFASSGDRLILGALVSAHVLGLYSVASGLVGAVDGVVQLLFSRVMLPVFGEIARNRPERVAETFFRLRWRLDPLIVFASGAMFSLGPFIVSVLYDNRYHDAGAMLQVLSLGLLVSRYAMVQQVYLALNKPRYQVVLNLVRATTIFVGVPAGYALFGLTGALLAIALKDLTSLPLIFWFNRKHSLNNLALEACWLLFWPVGWVAGSMASTLHQHL